VFGTCFQLLFKLRLAQKRRRRRNSRRKSALWQQAYKQRIQSAWAAHAVEDRQTLYHCNPRVIAWPRLSKVSCGAKVLSKRARIEADTLSLRSFNQAIQEVSGNEESLPSQVRGKAPRWKPPGLPSGWRCHCFCGIFKLQFKFSLAPPIFLLRPAGATFGVFVPGGAAGAFGVSLRRPRGPGGGSAGVPFIARAASGANPTSAASAKHSATVGLRAEGYFACHLLWRCVFETQSSQFQSGFQLSQGR